MRLIQIDKYDRLFETLRLSTQRAMSRTETKRSVDDYYQRAIAGDEGYAWYRDGVITNWQMAMNEWLADTRIAKVQRVDTGWRGYVAELHYAHYLSNREAVVRLQIQQGNEQLAYLKDEIAKTQLNIERWVAGNNYNNTE